MIIKKEYIIRTRKYLKRLDEKLNSIDLIKLEIEELKKLDMYQELDISKVLGFKSKSDYKDISDLKIYVEDQIKIKESEIDHIENKYKQLIAYINQYEHLEKEIIEYRYFRKGEGNSRYRLDDIALITGYSIATVKRLEKKMIEKIALFKYRSSAIEKNEPKVS